MECSRREEAAGSPPSKPPMVPGTPPMPLSEPRRRRREWPKSLYLLYSHFPSSLYSDSLYKLDLPNPHLEPEPEPEPDPEPFSPAAVFSATEETPLAREMNCARLGSTLYFAGGDFLSEHATLDDVFPRDAYLLDLASAATTTAPQKLEARLNCGKPSPTVVFAAEEKVFVLGSRPSFHQIWSSVCHLQFSDVLHLLHSTMKGKSFECYDPAIGKWRVLEEPPCETDDHTTRWEGHVHFKTHRLVLVFGWRKTIKGGRRIQLVYDLSRGKWLPQRVPIGRLDENYSLSSAAATADNGGSGSYYYSSYGTNGWGFPIKLKFKVGGENNKNNNNGGICLVSEATVEVVSNKSSHGIHGKNKHVVFGNPYIGGSHFGVYSLGDGYLCHVVVGSPGRPEGPDPWGYLPPDSSTQAVKVVVFKEVPCDNYDPPSSSSSSSSSSRFNVEILYTKQFVMKASSFVMGGLITGFVLSHDQQHKMKQKMKRNMKSDESVEDVAKD